MRPHTYALASPALLLAFSTGGCGADVQVDLAFSEVSPTVAAVSWSSRESDVTAAWFAYGLESPDENQVDLSLDASATRVLGLKAGRTYEGRVVVESNGVRFESEDFSFEPDAPPADFPSTDVEVFDAENAHDQFLLTTLFLGPAAPVILDSDGDYVWWYLPDNAYEVNYSRAVLAEDGESLLAWTLNMEVISGDEGPGGAGPGDDCSKTCDWTILGAEPALVTVNWEGTEVSSEQIDDGHHDLVALPNGGIAYLERDYHTIDGLEIEGDRIIERSADGTTTEIWSFWDDFDPEDHISGTPGTGWAHANALDYVADEDAYYVSSLGLSMILKIARSTGELEWALGGAESDFSDEVGGAWFFEHQHQFQRIGQNILVFDNGDASRFANQVLEFELDEEMGTAKEVWSYQPETDIFSFSLGDVSRLENGNTLVTFSNQGQIDEVNADGDLVWRLNFELGGATGYLTPLANLP